MRLADRPITHKCWRDLIDVRTLNALLNEHGVRQHQENRERTAAPTAAEVFARSDEDLIRIKNLGRKGLERIRRAQAHMLADEPAPQTATAVCSRELVERLRTAVDARPKHLAVPIDMDDLKALLAAFDGGAE